MGQYKVPQDVEAEDKILGPLTLKQFIYGLIGIGWAFLTFFIFAKLNLVIWIVVMAPVTILFGLLAGYQRDGQNFESLLMSVIGFFAQPRQRIWIKEPIAEVFRVEPPKIIKEQTQRDPEQVRSQLEQLGVLMDSRGKTHANTVPLPAVSIPSLNGAGTYVMAEEATERTVAIPDAQANPTSLDIHEADDVLDFEHNPAARAVTVAVDESEEAQRAQAIAQMRAQLAGAPEAHIAASTAPPPLAVPEASPASVATVTPSTSGAIIMLATESDDLSVSQIAAQANRAATMSEGETVILHDGTSK